jgi:hypothetical protein
MPRSSTLICVPQSKRAPDRGVGFGILRSGVRCLKLDLARLWIYPHPDHGQAGGDYCLDGSSNVALPEG